MRLFLPQIDAGLWRSDGLRRSIAGADRRRGRRIGLGPRSRAATDVQRLERLGGRGAGDLQAIADLVTFQRRREPGTGDAIGLAVVETLRLQLVLQGARRFIRAKGRGGEEGEGEEEEWAVHGLTSLTGPASLTDLALRRTPALAHSLRLRHQHRPRRFGRDGLLVTQQSLDDALREQVAVGLGGEELRLEGVGNEAALDQDRRAAGVMDDVEVRCANAAILRLRPRDEGALDRRPPASRCSDRAAADRPC